MNRESEMLTLSQIAIRAGVSPSAVSNWRKRYPDFPKPTDADRYAASEVNTWLQSHGKTPKAENREQPSQAIWRAADLTRGHLQPEDAVPAIATLITMVALGVDLTGTGPDLSAVAEQAEVDNNLPAGCLTEPLQPITSGLPNSVLWQVRATVTEVVAKQATPANAFDSLMSMVGPSRATAESLTGEAGIAFLQALLPKRADSIMDPACGSGGLLIRAADTVGATQIAGYDINLRAWALCVQRLLLHERPVTEIHHGDALTSAPTGFDLVVTHPPFGVRIHPDSPAGLLLSGMGVSATSGDFAWLLTARNALSPGGTALVLTSAAPTFQRAGAALRHELVRSGSVKAVIALPGATLKLPGTMVGTTVWVLGTPTPDAPPVLMINGAAGDSTQDVINAYTTWRDHPSDFEPEPGFSSTIPVLDLLVGDVDLNPAVATAVPIDPDQALREARVAVDTLQQAVHELATIEDIPALRLLPGDTPLVKLTDLAKVWRPAHLRRDDAQGEGTHPFVTGVTDGELRVAGYLSEIPPKATVTEPGDVVLGTIGRISAAVDYTGGHVLGSSVWRLQPKSDLAAHPDVLALLLNSARIQAQTSGTTIQRLRSPKDIEVACPDADTIAALEQWLAATASARSRASQYLDALQAAETAVVDALDAGAISHQEDQ